MLTRSVGSSGWELSRLGHGIRIRGRDLPPPEARSLRRALFTADEALPQPIVEMLGVTGGPKADDGE